MPVRCGWRLGGLHAAAGRDTLRFTERDEAERQLRRAQRMEAVGHLTGGVAGQGAGIELRKRHAGQQCRGDAHRECGPHEDQHRVGIGDRGEQQPLGVIGGRRLDDLQAGHMRIPGLQALAVLRGRAGAGARGHADHQRHGDRAAEHEAQLGGLIDDLVGGAHAEIGEAQFHHGARASKGRTDAGCHDHRLRDRRIDDAILAEDVLQAFVLAGKTAFGTEVLAQRPDAVITLHLLLQRQEGSLCIGQLERRHTGAPTS